MRRASLSTLARLVVFCALLPWRVSGAEVRGKADHVVLVVWDGMRADYLTEVNAPVLWQLAQSGVTFSNHHSVFPSLTNANSTVLATGVFGNRSGLLANYEYRPEFDPAKSVGTDLPEIVRKGDELSGGRYLSAPTVAELVQAAGARSAIVGGKRTSLLHDRHGKQDAAGDSVVLFSGETLPETALAPIVKLLGAFPDAGRTPGSAGDVWTTRALTEVLWANDVPRYSVLWLSEPDRAEHDKGPGSDAALEAIKSSDANLAVVLHALEQKRVRDKTDILVVSDHGFSTIQRGIDLRGLLKAAGFAVLVDRDVPAKDGEVRVVANGGMLLLYVTNHDAEVTARLVQWLQQSDFAGVLFSRAKIEGTFPLSQVHIDTPAAPDIVMTFRWNGELNKSGAPGMIAALGATANLPAATHGTFSKFDLHNILVAAGPDFRSKTTSDLPTSNIDVAPTILHLLRITPPQALDGRILHEALVNDKAPRLRLTKAAVEATRKFPGGTWRQHLQTTKLGDEVYIDEGNGELQSK
jgi:arylsulfatase A-like enzyme